MQLADWSTCAGMVFGNYLHGSSLERLLFMTFTSCHHISAAVYKHLHHLVQCQFMILYDGDFMYIK